MNNNYEEFRAEVFSAMRGLAKQSPAFADAQMLIASSDVTASLKRSTIHKNIDVEWIAQIEETLPYLDLIIRQPTVMIEDVDEILPVELSRNIAEKTIKHLAQHTNMIQAITDDGEVIPQQLLNVYHEETLLTYENKFINTLLARLSAFVDTRFKQLQGGCGTERSYQLRYYTEFEHQATEEGERNQAKIQVSLDLNAPCADLSLAEAEANERYVEALARIEKLHRAITSYMSSSYVRTLGRNYIRPPVIRTNAILKNKNMRECLNLWEYLESFDRAGFSVVADEYTEMPSDNYISDLYSTVALQYTDFYNGVAENPEDNRLLANRRLSEVYPDFDADFDVEELESYRVYDSEYKKVVPISCLSNTRKKLSKDERRVRQAMIVALKVDEILLEQELAREEEERRLERERRLAEEEALRQAAEEEARRIAEEEARRLAEEEAKRLAEEEAIRLAEEEEERLRLEAERHLAALARENALAALNRLQLEKLDFLYSDSDYSEENSDKIVIPYTRQQYLDLPRKKKKTIQMNVKKLIDYRDTLRTLEDLMSKDTANPYVIERIEFLQNKLLEDVKALPKSPEWDDCIRQLRK